MTKRQLCDKFEKDMKDLGIKIKIDKRNMVFVILDGAENLSKKMKLEPTGMMHIKDYSFFLYRLHDNSKYKLIHTLNFQKLDEI